MEQNKTNILYGTELENATRIYLEKEGFSCIQETGGADLFAYDEKRDGSIAIFIIQCKGCSSEKILVFDDKQNTKKFLEKGANGIIGTGIRYKTIPELRYDINSESFYGNYYSISSDPSLTLNISENLDNPNFSRCVSNGYFFNKNKIKGKDNSMFKGITQLVDACSSEDTAKLVKESVNRKLHNIPAHIASNFYFKIIPLIVVDTEIKVKFYENEEENKALCRWVMYDLQGDLSLKEKNTKAKLEYVFVVNLQNFADFIKCAGGHRQLNFA